MNQKVNRKSLITKEKSSVWKIKVGVLSPVLKDNLKLKMETKLWKIKVILN